MKWLIVLAFVAFSAHAGEAKKPLRKEAPQLAGFGMVALKHTCTLSYEGCLANCKNAGGVGCAEECAADCDVCSLDFGEEKSAICR